MKIVILAGGKGHRLWPISKEGMPKQFLALNGQESLLINTISRFQAEYETFVLVNESQAIQTDQELKRSGVESVKVLCEPVSKNTGFALVHAMRELYSKGMIKGDEPILFSPSDHDFETPGELLEAIDQIARDFNPKCFHLLGIYPNRGETAYGYIKQGVATSSSLYKVESFHEKPDKSEAQAYFKGGEYLWNSGLCCFSYQALYEELKRDDSPFFKYLIDGTGIEALPSLSFDHLVLEKTRLATVLPLKTNWQDLGSFDRLYDQLDKDSDGNSYTGDIFSLNSRRNFVIAESKPVGLIDVEDLIIAQSSAGICIAKRGSSSKVQVVRSMLADSTSETLIEKGARYLTATYKVNFDQPKMIEVEKQAVFTILESSLIIGGVEHHEGESVTLLKGSHSITSSDRVGAKLMVTYFE